MIWLLIAFIFALSQLQPLFPAFLSFLEEFSLLLLSQKELKFEDVWDFCTLCENRLKNSVRFKCGVHSETNGNARAWVCNY